MELRTFVLIDSMQAQYAALTGKLLRGDVPVEGMAEIFVELAPASDVYEVLDADGGVTDLANVSITITPVNDNDPVAGDDSIANPRAAGDAGDKIDVALSVPAAAPREGGGRRKGSTEPEP